MLLSHTGRPVKVSPDLQSQNFGDMFPSNKWARKNTSYTKVYMDYLDFTGRVAEANTDIKGRSEGSNIQVFKYQSPWSIKIN